MFSQSSTYFLFQPMMSFLFLEQGAPSLKICAPAFPSEPLFHICIDSLLHLPPFLFMDFFGVGWEWGLKSWLLLCKAAALQLGSSYFGDVGLENCLPRLISNFNPPDLSLPSS
jgi:hypothetical protein